MLFLWFVFYVRTNNLNNNCIFDAPYLLINLKKSFTGLIAIVVTTLVNLIKS